MEFIYGCFVFIFLIIWLPVAFYLDEERDKHKK